MKSIITVLAFVLSITASAQVSIPKKGGTAVNAAPTIGDTTITVKFSSKVSFDTTKVVVELLGDDGTEYLQPVYKRAYVIRKILTPEGNAQPQIEWQKLYDEKWKIITYGADEAKAVTPFQWKAKK